MEAGTVLASRTPSRHIAPMPLIRIDLPRGKTPEYRRTLGDVVYEAMIQTINVPANDRFQIFTEHPPDELLIDRTYLGIERSADCVLIQVFLNEGRTTELKKAFYRAIRSEEHTSELQ